MDTPIYYTLMAGTADFYYGCFNQNGSAPIPITSSNPGLRSSVTLTPRKSIITGSLSLSDETIVQCPNKGKLCLVGAAYTEMTLTDVTTPVGPVSLPDLSVGNQYSNTPLGACFSTRQCLGLGAHCSKSTECCGGFCGGSLTGGNVCN